MPDKRTLYVIDFDRTLIDVDVVIELAEKACKRAGLSFSDLKESYAKALTEARSYSPLKAIAAEGDEKLNRFKTEFFSLARSNELVFPDAKRYLKELDKHKKPYMILTYATDEEWQDIKLEASRLKEIPHVITPNLHKSKDIAGWRDDKGQFSVPVGGINPVDKIIFIDDRLRALEHLPPDCKGFWIQRNLAAEIQTGLPANVERINSFDQLIDRI